MQDGLCLSQVCLWICRSIHSGGWVEPQRRPNTRCCTTFKCVGSALRSTRPTKKERRGALAPAAVEAQGCGGLLRGVGLLGRRRSAQLGAVAVAEAIVAVHLLDDGGVHILLLRVEEDYRPAVDGLAAADEVDALVEGGGAVLLHARHHEPGVAHRRVGDGGAGVALVQEEGAVVLQALAVEVGQRADQHARLAVRGDVLEAVRGGRREGDELRRRVAQREAVAVVLVGGKPALVLGRGLGGEAHRPGDEADQQRPGKCARHDGTSRCSNGWSKCQCPGLRGHGKGRIIAGEHKIASIPLWPSVGRVQYHLKLQGNLRVPYSQPRAASSTLSSFSASASRAASVERRTSCVPGLPSR